MPHVTELEAGALGINRPTHLYRVAGTAPDVRSRNDWDKAVGKQTAALLSKALADGVSSLGLAVRRGECCPAVPGADSQARQGARLPEDGAQEVRLLS